MHNIPQEMGMDGDSPINRRLKALLEAENGQGNITLSLLLLLLLILMLLLFLMLSFRHGIKNHGRLHLLILLKYLHLELGDKHSLPLI